MSIILSPVALRNHLEEDLHPDAVFAYFDRIQVWLPYRLHRAEISRLRSQCRTHPYRKERKVLHVGKPWERHPDRRYRQRLELYRPTREALRFLERIRPTLVNEVELAVDLAFDDFAQVEAADEVMTAHSRKLWHGKQKVGFSNGTRYTSQREKVANNLVTYREDRGRIDGRSCLHIEWRCKGVRAVRAAGIESVADLTGFDHRRFWESRMRLACIDMERLFVLWWRETGRRRGWARRGRPNPSWVAMRAAREVEAGSTVQVVIDNYGRNLPLDKCLKEVEAGMWLPGRNRQGNRGANRGNFEVRQDVVNEMGRLHLYDNRV